jgi:hypothetical protein
MLFPVLSPKLHGILDYLVGLFFIASPWIFRFSHYPVATAVPIVIGAAVIGYSLFTDYPLGVRRAIPLFAHLWLDIGAGLLMCFAPFLLGFNHITHWTFIYMGAAEISLALITANRVSMEARHMDEAHHTGHGTPGMA